jgi:hypothetical protein
MPLQAIGTHRTPEKGDAITVTIAGVRLALTHAATTGLDADQVEAVLSAAASTGNVELPEVHVHVNRDGSLAIHTGKLPKDHVWLEDWGDRPPRPGEVEP